MKLTKIRIEFDKILGYGNPDLNNHLWNWVKQHSAEIANLESNRLKKLVGFAEPKHCIDCKHLTHEIDDYPFDHCNYFDITIVDMTKHYCTKIEARSN